ncbi:hypothetical protein [Thermoplasma sp.]|uniref:hypothetical protein n=1 Tax=Thermoplasma sp. TaxID=1973142 RepID=UPI0026082D9D|nr:hypothetical protein [Thermoplasma sp.]
MRKSLFSLILRTRVTSGFIAVIGIFLISVVLSLALSFHFARPVRSEFPFFAGIITFISFILMIGSAAIFKKSDFDFLFTSPIPARTLAINFFLASIVINSMYAFFLMYFLTSLEYPAFIIPSAIDLWLIMVANVSFANMLRKIYLRKRLILIGIILVWYLIPGFVSFPFSPISTFTGFPITGTVIDVLFASSFFFYNLIRPPKITYYYRSVMPGSSNVRKSIRFAGTTPIGAIYRFNLRMMGGSSTMRLGSVSKNYAGRINIGIGLVISIIIATLYGIGILLTPSTARSIIEIYYVIYALSIYPLIRGIGWIQSERIWLALMSMPATIYFRHMAIAKAISTLLILLPLVAANIILFVIYGQIMFMKIAIITLFISPSVTVMGFYLAGIVNPYQIIDIGEIPSSSRYSARNFVTGIVIAPLTAVAVIAVFIPSFYIYASITFAGLASVLIALPFTQNRLKNSILSHNLL